MTILTIAVAANLFLAGDSLAQGVSPYLPHDKEVILPNASIMDDWETLITKSKTIMLFLGSNDYAIPELDLEARLRVLLTNLKEKADQVILVGPPCHATDKFLNANYERIAQLEMRIATEVGVKFISLKHDYQRTVYCEVYKLPNGLNYTIEGNEILVELLTTP